MEEFDNWEFFHQFYLGNVTIVKMEEFGNWEFFHQFYLGNATIVKNVNPRCFKIYEVFSFHHLSGEPMFWDIIKLSF
jgi:hypothetical protein